MVNTLTCSAFDTSPDLCKDEYITAGVLDAITGTLLGESLRGYTDLGNAESLGLWVFSVQELFGLYYCRSLTQGILIDVIDAPASRFWPDFNIKNRLASADPCLCIRYANDPF